MLPYIAYMDPMGNRYLKFVQMNMKILRFPQTWVQDGPKDPVL